MPDTQYNHTTMELQRPPVSLGERLFYILQVAVPVMLTLVIIALVLFRNDVLNRFDAEATRTRTVACAAVKQSNDDLDSFLARTLGRDPRPEAQQFIADLKSDHAKTYSRCLATTR